MFNRLYEKVKEFIKNNYIFILLIVFIIFMFYYETPYMIHKSGGIISLSDRIEIDKEYEEKGSISMSYVTAMKGTPFLVLLSYIISDWDIEKIDNISNNDNYDDVIKVEKEYLKDGIDNAIIAAFNETGYKINIINENIKVFYISDKANTDIKVGDIIYKINDKEVKNISEVREYINSLNENDKVNILVKNNNKEYERYATLYKDTDNKLKIGVAFHTNYEYETEIPINIKMKDNESGSSGSLMMALQIYNALTTDDITKGLKIVGTGSINSDGSVEEIGGVKYKIIAAAKNKADIFFCPRANYDDAVEIKNKRNLKINIVSVDYLSDVINYLKEL